MRVRLGALVFLAMCVAVGGATAQDADWRAEVGTVLQEFEAAVRSERMISLALDRAHPDILAAMARSMDLSVEEFAQQARSGYRQTMDRTEVRDFALNPDHVTYGQTEGRPWAVAPYLIQLRPEGGRTYDAFCDQLVIFQDDGVTYTVRMTGERTNRVVFDAMPRIAEMIAAARTDC